MMIPAPGPVDDLYAPHFRLAGYGGAALFLRSQVVPGRVFGVAGFRPAYDVMLLAPDYHVWYLARQASDHIVDWLSSFMFAAAADFTPEETVLPFSDPVLGLFIRPVASTDDRVELEIRFMPDPHDPSVEADVLDFETSRYSLAAASEAIRVLDASWDVSEIDEELES
jgi:hypothetical protein